MRLPGAKYLEISEFPQPLFDETLLRLVKLRGVVAQQIIQNKDQKFLEVGEALAKFFLGRCAQILRELHRPRVRHAPAPAAVPKAPRTRDQIAAAISRSSGSSPTSKVMPAKTP